MPASERRYVAVGVYWADRSDRPEFLAVEGRLVVFDTAELASQVLPRLGVGRIEQWDAARETLAFTPLVRRGFNRLALFTGYDPYDVPNGFRALGIYSEAEGRDWRHHVYWRHVLETLIAWAEGLASAEEQETAA